MRIKEILKPRKVQTISSAASAEEAWNRMWLGRIHHLVVTDGAEVKGILSDRDLGGEKGMDFREGRSVADLMSPHAVTVASTATLREAANLMRGRWIGCLPVQERGKLVGIVTIFDLLTLLGKGAERPIARSRRWILKGRGPRRKAYRAR